MTPTRTLAAVVRRGSAGSTCSVSTFDTSKLLDVGRLVGWLDLRHGSPIRDVDPLTFDGAVRFPVSTDRSLDVGSGRLPWSETL